MKMGNVALEISFTLFMLTFILSNKNVHSLA